RRGALAVVWRPAAPGDRPGAGDRAQAAGAGRARCRHERVRNAGAAAVDREDPRRRHHRAADRTRHETGHGAVRPGAGAGIRQGARAGQARPGAARPQGDRGLPGRGRGPRRARAIIGASIMSATQPLLELRGLAVAYGGIRAVRGIDLHVNAGELVCLIGANGAGKSTTLRAICGLVPPSDGDIVYDGQSIKGRKSFELVRQGLVMVPEGRGIFGQLTIEENLAMGAYVRRDAAQVRRDTEHVFTLFPRLAERRRQAAGTLSGGEQQMVAMGRAMIARPRLLLLDEPSMGLAPLMVEKVFEVVRAIADEGVTI